MENDDRAMLDRLRAIFSKYMNGNTHAVSFCMDLAYVSHLWDDLIDGDRERGKEEINLAFAMALGSIPSNPFYRQHIEELTPLMMGTLLQWQIANGLERGDENEQLSAFIIRQAISGIWFFCMYLSGGYEWALRKGPGFWMELGSDIVAKYDEFRKEMN